MNFINVASLRFRKQRGGRMEINLGGEQPEVVIKYITVKRIIGMK